MRYFNPKADEIFKTVRETVRRENGFVKLADIIQRNGLPDDHSTRIYIAKALKRLNFENLFVKQNHEYCYRKKHEEELCQTS